jgi:methyl-accepting chemotaxis protein
LKAAAALAGLSGERAQAARKLMESVEGFTADASAVYGGAARNPAGITAAVQASMRELAARTAEMENRLKGAREQSAADLHAQLRATQEQSEKQRRTALWLFGATLAIAGVIVQFTIRRAIIAPVLRVMQGIEATADLTAQASDGVAKAGQAVARDAGEQATCLTETSATLEEISATTDQNAGRAAQADGLMRQGRKTVETAVRAMDDLTRSMGAISVSSNQVAAVLKSIDEIAFHTNILALNAAVEAARAGESGAGFSVVADEVRALAHRAAEAARQSGEIVETTIGDVSRGVEQAKLAQQAFTEVAGTIENSSAVVSEIAASSAEQARGVAHIGQAVSRADAATQSNAAHAQDTAENALALTEQVSATRRHIAELVEVMGLKASFGGA